MSMTPPAAHYFDSIAPEWETVRSSFFTDDVREAAIKKAYLRPEMVVADVGAGTGFMTAGLAALVSKVFVFDGSAAMLEQARLKLAKFSNLKFHEADGLDLPAPDGAFDAVFANMYLHHCPDPSAAIAELVRILKPGGRLVITDLDEHQYGWLKTEMADEWQGFERTQVFNWLKQAGLVNLLINDTQESCCASAPAGQTGDTGEAKISIFLATGTRRVSGARLAVQSSYSAAALGSAGCCPPVQVNTDLLSGWSGGADPAAASCCTPEPGSLIAIEEIGLDPGYRPSELVEIPAEAAEFSLGCGNPTAFARLQPGETVLDIGSGGGIDAFLAARQVGETGKVIGVDMTPAMIDRARLAAQKGGYPQVEFRLGQAEELPVENGTVDVILSNCVINLCEDKGQVFRETYRVLRSGGRLEISDVVSDGPPPPELRGNPNAWASCVWGALPETEYLDLIRQAGFHLQATWRSPSADNQAEVRFYSLQVSAIKPG